MSSPPSPTETLAIPNEFNASGWQTLASFSAKASLSVTQPGQVIQVGNSSLNTTAGDSMSPLNTESLGRTRVDSGIYPLGQPKPIALTPERYQLIEFLASGGQGEVWLARQTRLHRKLAVKMPKAGRVPDFLTESYTSAQLDHPNIAPIHDLGELERPEGPAHLLAMKFLAGQTWDDVMEADRALPAFNLEAFLQKHLEILKTVCNAVAYAHSQGIIHRDLKPAQVVVGEFGEIYLVDWGMAMSLSQEPTMAPDTGVPLVHTRATATNCTGTPAYMAPEQTRHSTEILGTHTDVYLLGGLLFHVLSGVPSHNAENAQAAWYMAMCNDFPDMPKEAPQELADLAFKAMEELPAHRVPSALAFRKGLEDYLSGSRRRREARQAVQAIESTWRQGKISPTEDALEDLDHQLSRAGEIWPHDESALHLHDEIRIERVKLALRQGDLGMAGSLTRSLRHESTRREMREEIAKAQSIRRKKDRQRHFAMLLARALGLVVLIGGGLATKRLMDAWEVSLQNESEARQKAAEAEVRLAIARRQGQGAAELIEYMLAGLKPAMTSELTMERGIDEGVAAEIVYGVANQVSGPILKYFSELDPHGWPVELQDEYADRLHQTGIRFLDLGLEAQALELAERGMALREQILDGPGPKLADSANLLGLVYQEIGDFPQAMKNYERALTIRSEVQGPESADTAIAMMNMGTLLIAVGRTAEARKYIEGAIPIFEKVNGPNDPYTTLDARVKLGQMMTDLGDFLHARVQLETVIAALEGPRLADSHYMAHALSGLADLEMQEGNTSGALEIYRRTLVLNEKHRGAKHRTTTTNILNIANALVQSSRSEEALPYALKAVETFRETMGREHAYTATALDIYGRALLATNQTQQAKEAFSESLEIREKVLGTYHLETGISINNVAFAMEDLGETTGTLELYMQGLEISERTVGPDHFRTAIVLLNTGRVLRTMGDLEQSLVHLERSKRILEGVLGPEHTTTANAYGGLARTLRALHRYEEAQLLFDKSLAIRERVDGAWHPSTISTRIYMGQLAADRGDLVEAHRQRDLAKRLLDDAASTPTLNIRTQLKDFDELDRMLAERQPSTP